MKELRAKLNKYIRLTEEALKKVKIRKNLNADEEKKAKELLNLAECYYKDCVHFKEKEELINAFTAINYAHAFLDVGAKLGLFNVKDSRLFMVG